MRGNWRLQSRNLPGAALGRGSGRALTIYATSMEGCSTVAEVARGLVTSTPVSLLGRLKVARPDSPDWRILQDTYLPLISRWLSSSPGIGEEAADLAQEVLLVVSKEVVRFDRRREGAFRAWLRKITVNRLRAYFRQRKKVPIVGDVAHYLAAIEDSSSELSREWDREHDLHVLSRLLRTVRADFSATTWRAFQGFALDGKPADQVASELGISENAVLISKSRVLKRLREESADLCD